MLCFKDNILCITTCNKLYTIGKPASRYTYRYTVKYRCLCIYPHIYITTYQ